MAENAAACYTCPTPERSHPCWACSAKKANCKVKLAKSTFRWNPLNCQLCLRLTLDSQKTGDGQRAAQDKFKKFLKGVGDFVTRVSFSCYWS